MTANEFGLQKYWLDQAIIQTIRLRRKFKNEDLDTMRQVGKETSKFWTIFFNHPPPFLIQVENKLKAIEENAKNRKLTMDHMQGPFYLVFSGALIGCIAFLLEHLSSVCSRDKK